MDLSFTGISQNEWRNACQIDNCFSVGELLFKYVTYLLLIEKMCEIAMNFTLAKPGSSETKC